MAPHHEAARAVAEAGWDEVDPAADLEAGLAEALREVTLKLDATRPGGERMRLLQRQAELGDLRDELALRARRRLAMRR
jgi:hypothetical protein